jgi:hypothetical protein
MSEPLVLRFDSGVVVDFRPGVKPCVFDGDTGKPLPKDSGFTMCDIKDAICLTGKELEAFDALVKAAGA